ncbi:MAG: DUF3617 domain-containing protein [Terriglobales bacterium]|jgi:hypothetical protein
MRSKLLLAVIVCFSLTVIAADKFTPLNIKEGLWEMTVTFTMTGMPAMPAIPPEALAKMPPEQRARIEGMMGGKPIVQKECITKEKLAKASAFSVSRGADCTRTVVNSTGSKIEMKIHCEGKQGPTDGTLVVESVGSEATKGSMHTSSSGGDHKTNTDMTFSYRYLGAACGDVK